MKREWFVALILGCFLSFANAQPNIVAPRQPLTFADHGLYGGWSEHVIAADSPFDYLIIQAFVYETHIDWNGKAENDPSTWSDWLARARANGKRVIADLCPAMNNAKGKLQSLASVYHDHDPVPEGSFLPLIDNFFREVDEAGLYAVTISEEHVYWNGQARRLEQAYEHIKGRYDVPVYQWYTPDAGAPGFCGFPNLNADGWMSDEYFLDAAEMEMYVRGYLIQRKPLLHIAWAAPQCASVPWKPQRFAEQLAVCRKYNIAPSYFTWVGAGGMWGWNPDSPRETRDVFEQYCIVAAMDAKRTSSTTDHAAWEYAAAEPKWIMLQCDPEGRERMGYADRFNQRSHVKFLNDVEIRGFANLKWDSSPLQLCSRQSGSVESTLTWRFQSPLPGKSLKIALDGATLAGNNARVTLRVTDAGGNVLGEANAKGDGSCNIVLDAPAHQRFIVTCHMSGQATRADEVLAELEGLRVDADIATTNAAKPISLQPDANGDVHYSDDFRNLTILHTAYDTVWRTNLTMSPGWLYAGGKDDIDIGFRIIQKFSAARPIQLSELWIKGFGNETRDRSRFGIGISFDGENPFATSWSNGEMDGTVRLDLAGVQQVANGVTEFYVHLLLEANGKKTLLERCGMRGFGLRGHGRLSDHAGGRAKEQP